MSTPEQSPLTASPASSAGPPSRANRWQLRTRWLELSPRPLLMGVVNVTPDSFSDGGRFLDPGAAVEHGLRLADEGAEILDLGAESTRPGSQPVAASEQWRRLEGVISGLLRQTSVPLSIDTMLASVARRALDAGAEVINDITALTGDPDMLSVALATGCGLCAMHMQGRPETMQQQPVYADVVTEVRDYLRGRRDAIVAAGIAPQRIALDPGIGFGKTYEHNLALLASAGRFLELGAPVLYGPSRKAFIGRAIGDSQADRTAGTIAAALALAARGVQIVRVHDIAPVRQALAVFEACGGCAQRSHHSDCP